MDRRARDVQWGTETLWKKEGDEETESRLWFSHRSRGSKGNVRIYMPRPPELEEGSVGMAC